MRMNLSEKNSMIQIITCKKQFNGDHKMKTKSIILWSFLISSSLFLNAQDTLRYIGTVQSDINYSDGQLRHAMGVHNIQVMRANRQHPEFSDGYGWTYNHGPNLAYWNGKFYLNYLSTPHGEHIQPGQTLLSTSVDGYNWTFPEVIFPTYKIPAGTKKQASKELTIFTSYPGMQSVMHQRMGFYVSKKNRLLTLGYYGISFGPRDFPNGGNGIGRVVREVFADGTFGDIFFIRYNKGFSEENTSYPFYTKSKDKGFVEACRELLADKLMIMQWREESDRDDPLFTINDKLPGDPSQWPGGIGVYRAFNFYHLPDNRVVGLWKQGLYSISNDEGAAWSEVRKADNVLNGGGKFWGQKTSDGRYAIAYNPDPIERYPLAVMTSWNGLDYDTLLCLHGEVSPCRYKGTYKDYGPQYVRGIIEGNGTPPEGKMWLTYSMNKEDIWVSSIPIPVKSIGNSKINDVFNDMKDGMELNEWNIYSPLWAPVKIEKSNEGEKNLVLRDKDRYDYAKATRIFKPGINIQIKFNITPSQTNGDLFVELQNMKGEVAASIIFDQHGDLKVSNMRAYNSIGKYETGKSYNFSLVSNPDGKFMLNVNGKEINNLRWTSSYIGPVERIVFRTGESFVKPRPDPVLNEAELQIDEGSIDLPFCGEAENEVSFLIKSLHIESR